MIYDYGKMRLLAVTTVSVGEVNDCYICRDLASSGGALYTVIIIHDHEVVRKILELFKLSERKGEGVLITDFSIGDGHALVFPYHRERPLLEFYEAKSMTLAQCEEICISTVLACITSDLPYPILYLLLTEAKLNLSSDRSVFLSFDMDLSKLDETKGEGDCTRECATIILELLRPKSGQKATSFYLLDKKVANGSYNRFTDLYRDITIAAVTKKKITPLFLIRLWIKRNSDVIIGIFFWISVILAVLALSILVSQIFLGGNSWFRILFNTFKRIGKESLLQ